MTKDISATIVILTKNPDPAFPKLLDAISRQIISNPIEVLIIDSGQDEWVKELVEKKGFSYIAIEPHSFSHGNTRNFGATKAQGKYVVFITQDALPADNNWLTTLIGPLTKDPEIAGVYSRQIPYKTTHPMEKYFLLVTYKEERKINVQSSDGPLNFENVFFSNVSSAIRKEVLVSYPFEHSLVMSEDQEWSKKVIEGGFKTQYEPTSVVYHSHHYTFREVFKRNFDSGTSLHQIFCDMPGGTIKNIKIIAGLIGYLIRSKKAYLIPSALAYECVKTMGFICGWNEKYLPNSLKIYLGAHRQFWINKKKNNLPY